MKQINLNICRAPWRLGKTTLSLQCAIHVFILMLTVVSVRVFSHLEAGSVGR